MTSPNAAHVESGLLLLADISGYTSFLENVAEAHPDVASSGGAVPPAYDLMLTLLDGVAEALQPQFTPIQTEGDAIFAVAGADVVTGRGDEVLASIRATHTAFRDRTEENLRMQNHVCSACNLITSLELKFVLHAGSFVVQDLPTRTHVAGPAVNLAHRLLKNRVTDETGQRGYALMTDAALELIGLDPAVGLSHTEAYADAGAVSGIVIGLTPVAR